MVSGWSCDILPKYIRSTEYNFRQWSAGGMITDGIDLQERTDERTDVATLVPRAIGWVLD